MTAFIFFFQAVIAVKWGDNLIPEGPYHGLLTYAFLIGVLGVGALFDLMRYLHQIKAELVLANKQRAKRLVP